MHTRQGVAKPAFSQHTETRHLEHEARSICAAARAAGRYTLRQRQRLVEIATLTRDDWQPARLPAPEPPTPTHNEVQIGEPVALDPEHGMYPRETNLDGSTRHSRHCKAGFGRRDWSCHRCCELLAASLPRKSSHREYIQRKLNQNQRHFLW